MEKAVDPEELLRQLSFALQHYPERVDVVPLREVVMDSARQNDKRPAYVKIALPDDLVRDLRGRDTSSDLVLLIQVPREVTEREKSPIVLPGEV